MVTNEERGAKYAQACGDPGSVTPRPEGESVSRWAARAVLAVTDAEQAELRVEVERLQGLLGVAEVRAGWKVRAEAAEASLRAATQRIVGYDQALADAEAKVARVEALHDKWATARNISDGRPNPVLIGISATLRAALDGDA